LRSEPDEGPASWRGLEVEQQAAVSAAAAYPGICLELAVIGVNNACRLGGHSPGIGG